jgi:hypothetical protein
MIDIRGFVFPGQVWLPPHAWSRHGVIAFEQVQHKSNEYSIEEFLRKLEKQACEQEWDIQEMNKLMVVVEDKQPWEFQD